VNKDQKLLEEAYQRICEGAKEPLYFGPKKDKEKWFKWLNKHYYKVNEDGSVSIEGDVELLSQRLRSKINRLAFNFNRIDGRFVCVNHGITTLEGGPKYVAKDFSCAHNKIKSLEGSPEYVGEDFNCYGTQITSLEGAPKVIKGEFYGSSPNMDGEIVDKDYRKYMRDHELSKRADKELSKDFSQEELDALKDF